MAEIGRVGEHVRLGECAGVFGLIPPGHGAVETAFGAEDLFEGPEVVAVPDLGGRLVGRAVEKRGKGKGKRGDERGIWRFHGCWA